MSVASFAGLVAGVADRLGVTKASASARVRSLGRALVHSLALTGEQALDRALDLLVARGAEEVAKLVAHGPHEQARAAMTPEQVSPPAKPPEPTGDLPANEAAKPKVAAPKSEPKAPASAS